MYRNQYDTDCQTWSPQGRIHQIEYAINAVSQGTVAVGIRSDNFAVLGGFKRTQSQLASYQNKLFRIDDHMGIAISGLTADARVLASYMRMECLNEKYTFEKPLNVGRLIAQIGDKSQEKTQKSSKRPYGVGLLVAGYDTNGPHIYETCPSGNYYEYKAFAIGGRSQSAKTYLEKHVESFPGCNLEDLITHVVKSINVTSGDTDLSTENICIAYVGLDTDFTELTKEQLEPYIQKIKDLAPTADGAAQPDADAMET